MKTTSLEDIEKKLKQIEESIEQVRKKLLQLILEAQK